MHAEAVGSAQFGTRRAKGRRAAGRTTARSSPFASLSGAAEFYGILGTEGPRDREERAKDTI